MKKLLVLFASLIAGFMGAYSQITLEYCLEKAEANYPLIKKYDLIRQTSDISLSDINKSWLPAIGVYAQGTVQNVVPSYPKVLESMMTQSGVKIMGLDKLQYKLGVDLQQTIWDGGNASARRNIERAKSAENEAAIEMQLYSLREKIQQLFFGTLLMQEQSQRIQATRTLLESNLKLMQSMVRNGTAMQSDADMIEAQLLTLNQQLSEANNAEKTYRNLISIYINEDITDKAFIRPAMDMPHNMDVNRPELTYFEKQLEYNGALEKMTDVGLMPKFGFFAQAYYGYPGYNYFESMMNRNLTFNAIAGLKISWNVDALYTAGNSRKKIALAEESIRNDRDVFLFNTKLKSKDEQMAIEGMRDVIKDDSRIVELRSNVRQAAESQLKNGVIDTNALLTKINDETQAKLTATFHEIQLLQNIYQLNNTINYRGTIK